MADLLLEPSAAALAQNAAPRRILGRADFRSVDTVLVKVGTGVVTTDSGHLALGRLGHLVEQIAELHQSGKKVLLVSSGSVGIGRRKLNKQALLGSSIRSHLGSFNDGNSIEWSAKACAAAGQSRLVSFYETLFAQFDIKCAQVLVTDQDFNSASKRQQFASTLTTLLQLGIVPVLNENDVISTRTTPLTDNDHHIFWDNDSLASLVASVMNVQLEVLLTDVDGLYDAPPSTAGTPGRRQPRLMSVYRGSSSFVIGTKSRVGRGGMQAKIEAAIDAVRRGVPAVVIASGFRPQSLRDIVRGDRIGTLFCEASFREATVTPRDQAVAARKGSRALQALSTADRCKILNAIADALQADAERILEANKRDLQLAEMSSMSDVMQARLVLSHEKIASLCAGIRQIAAEEEPVGRLIRETEVADGLRLKQETAPIGVLLIIFESRPDAMPQISALALRSCNGLLLKGGKEAMYSNQALHEVIVQAIEAASDGRVPRDVIGLVESREDVSELLALDDVIDLVIPRGSNALVRHIQKNTKIPVLGHAEGVCHVFVDKDANVAKAIAIVVDSKTDYPAACNAVETILVHERLVESGEAATIVEALRDLGVKLYGGARAAVQLQLEPAVHLSHEYGALEATVEIVASLEDAIHHINEHGSSHTDTIVTENAEAASTFLGRVDSACVFHNASTRFADGFRFGLGAEVGISTGRIHARGPVGVDGLLSTRWTLRSQDHHVVRHFKEGSAVYTHKKIV